MQTSAQRGFSLLEVLVVLAIVGVLLSGVTLAFNQTDARRLEQSIHRLEVSLQYAAEQAAVTGQTHRLVIQPHGFEFERLRAGTWQPILEPPLSAFQWPSGVSVKADTDAIEIHADGLSQPFQMQASLGQQRREVNFDALGRRPRPGH